MNYNVSALSDFTTLYTQSEGLRAVKPRPDQSELIRAVRLSTNHVSVSPLLDLARYIVTVPELFIKSCENNKDISSYH